MNTKSQKTRDLQGYLKLADDLFKQYRKEENRHSDLKVVNQDFAIWQDVLATILDMPFPKHDPKSSMIGLRHADNKLVNKDYPQNAIKAAKKIAKLNQYLAHKVFEYYANKDKDQKSFSNFRKGKLFRGYVAKTGKNLDEQFRKLGNNGAPFIVDNITRDLVLRMWAVYMKIADNSKQLLQFVGRIEFPKQINLGVIKINIAAMLPDLVQGDKVVMNSKFFADAYAETFGALMMATGLDHDYKERLKQHQKLMSDKPNNKKNKALAETTSKKIDAIVRRVEQVDNKYQTLKSNYELLKINEMSSKTDLEKLDPFIANVNDEIKKIDSLISALKKDQKKIKEDPSLSEQKRYTTAETLTPETFDDYKLIKTLEIKPKLLHAYKSALESLGKTKETLKSYLNDARDKHEPLKTELENAQLRPILEKKASLRREHVKYSDNLTKESVDLKIQIAENNNALGAQRDNLKAAEDEIIKTETEISKKPRLEKRIREIDAQIKIIRDYQKEVAKDESVDGLPMDFQDSNKEDALLKALGFKADTKPMKDMLDRWKNEKNKQMPKASFAKRVGNLWGGFKYYASKVSSPVVSTYKRSLKTSMSDRLVALRNEKADLDKNMRDISALENKKPKLDAAVKNTPTEINRLEQKAKVLNDKSAMLDKAMEKHSSSYNQQTQELDNQIEVAKKIGTKVAPKPDTVEDVNVQTVVPPVIQQPGERQSPVRGRKAHRRLNTEKSLKPEAPLVNTNPNVEIGTVAKPKKRGFFKRFFAGITATLGIITAGVGVALTLTGIGALPGAILMGVGSAMFASGVIATKLLGRDDEGLESALASNTATSSDPSESKVGDKIKKEKVEERAPEISPSNILKNGGTTASMLARTTSNKTDPEESPQSQLITPREKNRDSLETPESSTEETLSTSDSSEADVTDDEEDSGVSFSK